MSAPLPFAEKRRVPTGLTELGDKSSKAPLPTIGLD